MFVGLVVVHELGHFFAARRNGVVVEEFGIGFPPTAWSRKLKSGLLFSINWLPLGGFVRLKGEHDADKSAGSYGRASLWGKTKIMVAGVGMNLVTAYVLLLILALVGMPKLVDNQFIVERDSRVVTNEVLIGFVEPDSPAHTAGLQTNDRLMHIGPVLNGDCSPGTGVRQSTCADKNSVTTSDALPSITVRYASQAVPVTIVRKGQTLTKTITLRSHDEVEKSLKTDNPKGYLGISPTEYTLRRSTWSAPIVAAGLIKQFTQLTLSGIGHALGGLAQGHAKEASQQVAGPIGIFVLLKDGSALGYQFVLMIIAIISLTLAIMNVLPIPALDGGRLFVTYLFRIVRRPLTKKKEEWIHGTGFAMLMVLFVLITIVDIQRNF